ncbi:MAG: L-serine ammonia-lyase, iron-sulfur-dependent, subunit alpha [Candidatus Cloacimonetes bacterium]|nr:L-serine ammonia-lyase, iron-sulfur-dependent, subunit alpha [Candidatus Cloacimonadota bacterium]MCB5286454.1 L-serine ammonia-lyase, iron-sulfur-dependent, subunit alpha [Candidatus Cloacimonadota bacterium]MCK9184427.1 L-serine ammonia-lyase, iron-sulfur-dependent, subunit alpha [Candidatus Cloacimonadota bacterium]MDY0228776.1 L-serine ammonia-lyase, iron-sulfur-dependent, subunit alpha [Candidatus Cloacimonadaceae bacterium]
MRNFSEILALLKQEVVPALGCTEPAAVALATAYAASILPGQITNIQVKVSPSIYKNGMGVGIPNTGLIGLEIAAALGAVCANPEKQLEVLKDLSPEQLEAGKSLAAGLEIGINPDDDKVYVEAILSDGKHSSRAVIRWRHSWLYRLELDDKVLKSQIIGEGDAPKLISASQFRLQDYYDFCTQMDYEAFSEIDLGETLNRKIADFGLSDEMGMSVGKMILQQIKQGLLGDDIHHWAMALTAAATDARMSGCNYPVMANTGSGNQGLSITLPIIAAVEKLGCSHEQLLRALALGHLVTVHIKEKIGLLSSLCGCLSASAGAASGIVLLLGGDYLKVEYAIKNMIGNTTGMLCDGAKGGCSLKVATNTSAAVQAALLANMGTCISSRDGIITDDIDETIDNLADFINNGLQDADKTILNIIMNKKNNKEAKHV